MKNTIRELRKILANTRGRSRKDIILAVKAWEIRATIELEYLHIPSNSLEFWEGAKWLKKEVLGGKEK